METVESDMPEGKRPKNISIPHDVWEEMKDWISELFLQKREEIQLKEIVETLWEMYKTNKDDILRAIIKRREDENNAEK